MEPPTTAPPSISFISYHKARIPEPEEDTTRSASIRHKEWVRGRQGKNLPLLAPCPSSIFNSCLPHYPPPLPPPAFNNEHCRLMMTIVRICFYFLLPRPSPSAPNPWGLPPPLLPGFPRAPPSLSTAPSPILFGSHHLLSQAPNERPFSSLLNQPGRSRDSPGLFTE